MLILLLEQQANYQKVDVLYNTTIVNYQYSNGVYHLIDQFNQIVAS